MLRLFALTDTGNLYHWTNRGWEVFTGGPHQRPMEFEDATEGREYLSRVKIRWPDGTIDRYFGDPDGNTFLGSHDLKPFEMQ